MIQLLRKYLLFIGLATIAIGFAYELFFAGIPYQDPTPEMTARYMRDDYISMVMIQVGLAMVVGGILLKALSGKRKNLY